MISSLLSKYRYVLLIYFGVALIFFARLLFSEGAVLGGDWALPVTDSQIDHNLTSLQYAWTHAGNPFGTRQVAPVSIIFAALFKLFSLVGISAALFSKLFLISLFALAAANMNLFLRKIGLEPKIALLGGLLYITTPIFFNYSLMGWLFVLLSMALLPLFILLYQEAVAKKSAVYALLAAVLFSLAILQSQSLFWYSFTLVIFAITSSTSRESFWTNVKYFFIVMGGFLVLNAYWLPALLFLPERTLLEGDLVNSSVSIGTSLRLAGNNILRLWGSLFNYQFESTYPPIPLLVSYLLPLLALCALFFKKYIRLAVFLILLYAIPFFFSLIDRQYLAYLPFSDIIRDVARFTTLSTFAAIALASITLNELSNKLAKNKLVFGGLIFLLSINTLPFWTGEFYRGSTADFDFRFRTMTWPKEYYLLEEKLSLEPDTKRAIFLPLGGTVSSKTDFRYAGAFREMGDVFAGYSPVPGVLSLSDRSQGISAGLIKEMNEVIVAGDSDSFRAMTENAGIDFFILRRDLNFSDEKIVREMLDEAIDNGWAEVYFDQGQILAVKLKKSTGLLSAKTSLYRDQEVFKKSAAELFPLNISKVVPESDFEVTRNLADLYTVLGSCTSFVYEGQKQLYPDFDSESFENSISDFFQIQELENVILRRRNLIIERANPDDFVTFIEGGQSNSTLFFKPEKDKPLPPTFEFNGQKFETGNALVFGDLRYVSQINAKEGLNTFKSESLTPLFIVNNFEADSENKCYPVQSQKISPVKYKIQVDNPGKGFVIEFKESFSQYWKLAITNPKSDIGDSQHFASNGFANGWVITQNDVDKLNLQAGDKIEMTLEFTPQRNLVWGSFISVLGLIVIIGLYLRHRFYVKK